MDRATKNRNISTTTALYLLIAAFAYCSPAFNVFAEEKPVQVPTQPSANESSNEIPPAEMEKMSPVKLKELGEMYVTRKDFKNARSAYEVLNRKDSKLGEELMTHIMRAELERPPTLEDIQKLLTNPNVQIRIETVQDNTDQVKLVKTETGSVEIKSDIVKGDKSVGKKGYLSIICIPWAHVSIDGKYINYETPVFMFKVNTGRHVLLLTTDDGRRRYINIEIKKSVKYSVKVRISDNSSEGLEDLDPDQLIQEGSQNVAAGIFMEAKTILEVLKKKDTEKAGILKKMIEDAEGIKPKTIKTKANGL